MSDVFISYARTDKVFVRRLFDALAAEERDAWVDWEGIPLTADWWAEIQEGIEAADAFVFIISSDSVTSQACQQEITHAAQYSKRIVPLVYRDTETRTVPVELAKLNWLFFRDSEDFDQSLQSLIELLDTNLEWVKAHTRLLVRAREWEDHDRNNSYALQGDDLNEAETLLTQTSLYPEPTALQREYVLASRRYATRRQRWILGWVTVALAVAIVLGIVAYINSQLAASREAETQRRLLESQSLAQVAYARQAVAEDDHNRALALALAANAIPNPPGQAQILLAECAYAPGALRTMEGHERWVRQVAFSPDGETILSISDDDQVIVWNPDDEKPIRRYAARLGDLFTPDLRCVLSLRNEDHSLTLTDIESGELRQRFEGHSDSVASAAFSPEGAYLVAGARDGTIIIWNVQSGKPIHAIQLDGDTATSLAFSADGSAITAGTEQGHLYLWDTETWQQKTFAGQHGGRITSLAFAPDGNHLISGSFDTTVAVWNLWNMERGHTFTGHYGSVVSVSVSPDGKMIISGGCGPLGEDEFCTLPGQVILWDIQKVTEMRQIDAYRQHTGGVFSVAFSPDSQRAVSSGTDRTVILWDVSKPEQLKNTQLQSGLKLSIALNPDTHEVLVDSGSNLVLWNLTTNEIIHTYTGHEASIFSVALSPDGQQAISGDWDGTVMLWDLEQVAAPRSVLRGHVGPVNRVAFSPDGRHSLSAAKDGTVIYWDLESGEALQTFTVRPDTALDVAFSPDGSYALSGLSIGNILLWDLASGATIRTLAGHTEPVNSVTFSPDGHQALSGSRDATLILWDVSEGTINHTLEAQERGVTHVVFSPDGTTAISGHTDGALILWNLAMGEAVRVLREYDDDVRALAYNADGTRVLSSSPYTQIVEWRIDSLEALKQWGEENRIVHAFTCQERELYGVQPPCETQRGSETARVGDTSLLLTNK